MFPGIPELSVCRRLVELLASHPSPRVQKSTLKTVESIFKYDRQQTDLLIEQCGVIPILHTLLTQNDVALRSAACSSLAQLALHHPNALVYVFVVVVVHAILISLSLLLSLSPLSLSLSLSSLSSLSLSSLLSLLSLSLSHFP